ncbi:uncharacterized protein MYCGRDRAFT_109763 [Zymoseptoria tritici IPO323]|uniref:Carboxylic ester hydrolase n=1 Tax=Zymoseptoria tritici (strain CBS 115943 / IPO323) TaxID=336722 RepID=F9XCU2_ZYMTI|nr:uncharacterized protein MYCGRDRAFT_109763 [Zymoseptoria tritici IPO323]EGP86909.1 hypothetical protein MYCGRDRAFT_109763 [Zymoseptoria tritici IPO323]
MWTQQFMKNIKFYPLPCELEHVNAALLEACDGMDGVEDGIISLPGLCDFDPEVLIGQQYNCNGTMKTFAPQTAAIAKEFWTGPKDPNGRYSWYGLTPGADFFTFDNATTGNGGAGTVCQNASETSCMGIVEGYGEQWTRYFVEKDAEFDVLRLTVEDFFNNIHKSVQEYDSIIGTTDPDLSEFHKRRGKMITWHGLTDQLIPPNVTKEYYERVMDVLPNVHDFYRTKRVDFSSSTAGFKCLMEFVRPAGLNELRCIARDDLKLYGSIVTLGTYIGPRVLQSSDFVQILKRCVTEHPMLGVVVHDAATEHPKLFRVESLDLNAHLQMLSSASADEESTRRLLESIHNDPLPGSNVRPQWRMVVQPIDHPSSCRFRLAFAASHSLVDGRSGFTFHTAVLNALEGLKQLGMDSSAICQPGPTTLIPPAMEKAGMLPISWKFLLGPLVGEYCPGFVGRLLGLQSNTTADVWCGAPSRPNRVDSDPVTSVALFSISPDIVDRALAICRKHDARITGLLNHVIARSLCRALDKRQRPFTKLVCETPIDLRRALKQGKGQICNYVSAVTETVDVKRTNDPIDWTAVQKSTELLEERSKSLQDQPTGLLKYLSDFRGWTLNKASSSAEVSFSVSNLGVLDASVAGWQVDSMAFSQSGNGTGEPLSFSVASVGRGGMTIAVTWWPGMLGVEDEDCFVREVGRGVEKEMEAFA